MKIPNVKVEYKKRVPCYCHSPLKGSNKTFHLYALCFQNTIWGQKCSLFSFSLMLRFFGDEINQKSFFSTKSGYSSWDSINNDYQVQAIHFFRGWTRALVDFAGGINCRESIRNIGQRYQSLPSVNFVYLDKKNECR